MLTKNAAGKLITKYRSVLAKCRLLNAFGSLALAALMVTGGPNVGLKEAHATTFDGHETLSQLSLDDGETLTISDTASLTLTGSTTDNAVLTGGTLINYGTLTISGLEDGTTLTASGDFVTMDGVTTFESPISIIANVTMAGGTIFFNDSTDISGELTITGGEASFDNIITTVLGTTTISGGSLHVETSTLLLLAGLDLSTANTSNGIITVAGTLSVDGTITWGTSEGSVSNQIIVYENGTLITSTSNIYTYDNEKVTLVEGLSSADLSFDDASTLAFSGVFNITKAEYDMVKAALLDTTTGLGDDFLFNFGDATIANIDETNLMSTTGNDTNIDYNAPSKIAAPDGSGFAVEGSTINIEGTNSGSLGGIIFSGLSDNADNLVYNIGDNALTLAGTSDGGSLLTALTEDGTELPTSLLVGSGGTLNLGIPNTEINRSGSLESVGLSDNASLNVTGSTLDASATSSFAIIDGITLGDNASIYVSDNAFLSIGGTTLLGDGASIAVVDSSTATFGLLQVVKDVSNGGAIFIDPSYVAIKAMENDTLDCNIYVGEGSTLSLGTQDFIAYTADNGAELTSLLSNIGLSLQSLATGGVVPTDTAQTLLYLGLGKTLTLGTGSLLVDDAVTESGDIGGTSPTGLYLGADSFLVANMSGFDANTALINGDGADLYVDAGSSLGLVGASAGTYTILEGFGADTGNGLWDADNVFVSNILQEITGVDGNGVGTAYTVTVGIVEDSPLYGGAIGKSIYAAAHYQNGAGFSANSDLAGVRLIYNMTSSGKSTKKILAALEGAGQLAATAGTNANTLGANRAAVNVQRGRYDLANVSGLEGVGTSMTSSDMNVVTYHADGSVKEEFSGVYQVASNGMTQLASSGNLENLQNRHHGDSLALWFMPLYAHENVSGMRSGDYNSDYTTDMYGAALGIDKTISPSFADAVRMGLAFHVGSGDTSTSGDFDGIESDFDFFGLSAYGAAQFGAWTLSADLSYTKNDSEIGQDLSAFGVGSLKASVDSDIWHMGLRAEYTHISGNDMRCSPYLGLDFSTMKTQDYGVYSSANSSVFSVESERQNVFSVPVGFTVWKAFALESGWIMQPKASLGGIFAMGDLEEKSTTSITGLASKDQLSTDLVDPATLDFALGFTATQGPVRLALDYNVQISDHRVAHGLMGLVEYKF